VQCVDYSLNVGTRENPWYQTVPDKYVLERTVEYPDDSRTFEEVLRHGKKLGRWMCWIPNGYRSSLKTYYGIKSYQDVTLEDM